MLDPLVTIWKEAMERRKQYEVMTDIRLFLAHIAGDSASSDREKVRAQELLDALNGNRIC